MKRLMHKNSMDVFFTVDRIQYSDAKRTKYRGRWQNLGYTGKPWDLESHQVTLTIYTHQAKDWIMLSNEQIYTPRTAPGVPA